MSWAWKQSLPLGPKAALVALANFADGDGVCFPGQARLADMLGVSERALRNYLIDLEQRGFISRRQRRRADGSRTSDEYKLRRGNPIQQPAESAGSPATNRQILPNQPAESAGHEPSVEPSVQDQDLTPPSPPEVLDLVARNHTLAARAAGYSDPLLEIWNDNCGSLPQARVLTGARRKRFANLRRELGDETENVFRAAVLEVAGDRFWQEKPYGLDNLLVDGRVVEKAEKHVASRGLSGGDRRLAGTAKAIADAIGGL
jgi:hypothetical protein